MPGHARTLTIALALLTCCTSSAAPRAVSPATQETVPPPTLRPARCPAALPSTRWPSVPGAGSALVPGDPFALVVCRYGRVGSGRPPRRIVLDARATRRLARILDDLRTLKSGAFDCPAETTIPLALFFSDRDGNVQLVTVATTGCRFASNGRVTAQETRSLERLVRRIA